MHHQAAEDRSRSAVPVESRGGFERERGRERERAMDDVISPPPNCHLRFTSQDSAAFRSTTTTTTTRCGSKGGRVTVPGGRRGGRRGEEGGFCAKISNFSIDSRHINRRYGKRPPPTWSLRGGAVQRVHGITSEWSHSRAIRWCGAFGGPLLAVAPRRLVKRQADTL